MDLGWCTVRAGFSGWCVGTMLENHICHGRSDMGYTGALYTPWTACEGQAGYPANPQMASFQTLNLALQLHCIMSKLLSLAAAWCSDCSEEKKPTWQIPHQALLHSGARLSMSDLWTRWDLQRGSLERNINISLCKGVKGIMSNVNVPTAFIGLPALEDKFRISCVAKRFF